MTEFNLTNGQAIELTKGGVLIKGNHIEIDGNVTIVKDDKHANIVEQDDKRIKVSIVTIYDEPVTTKVDLNTTLIKQAIDNLLKEIESVKLQRTPRVRIEFDHINDIPIIFVDGEKVQGGLVSLNVDWKTNTENHVKKLFEVKVINKDGYGTTIGENSLI